MKKQIVSILAFASVTAALIPATIAFADSSNDATTITYTSMFPSNDMNIPATSFSATTNVTEAQFNASIARAEKLFQPIFAAQGRTYKIIPAWNDGTVNAFADRSGKVSQVHMFGGLARHPMITPDAFELVICHETGHHLGGAPKTHGIFGNSSWASDEGEADYYATLKCARALWANDDNAAIVEKMNIPAIVTEKCQKSFDAPNDLAICMRASMGGKALADTLSDLSKTPPTHFETPDTSVVNHTNDQHPAAQCRLDTYFAGATCAKKNTVMVMSDKDPTADACAQEKGDTLGIRPTCWYKPIDPNHPEKTGSTWPSATIGRR